MSDRFRTVADYEHYIYSLHEEYPFIRRSTLVLVRRGSSMARVEGELYFEQEIRLAIRERLLVERSPILIDAYGYEVWQGKFKLYWYDSQPHPTEPTLQSTHPHHKHIPPNMKRNRIPAPNMAFNRPNIFALVEEILQVIALLERPAGDEQP